MRKLLIDNEYATIESRGNVIIGTIKVDLMDINVIKDIVELRLKVTEDFKPYPFLVNIRDVKNSTKEVRDFLASKKAAERVTVTALLIDSMVSAAIGNFFMRISKPPVPTKIFTDEGEAIKWLNTLMPNSEI